VPSGRCPTVGESDPSFELFEGTFFNNECLGDDDCFVGGCSGEVCTAEEGVNTMCLVLESLPTGSCGCVNNQCIWHDSSCDSGIDCSLVSCLIPDCGGGETFVPEGGCCPKCVNDEAPVDVSCETCPGGYYDGCNTCMCTDNGVACTEIACPVSSQVITLKDESGNLVSSSTTGDDGAYTFDDLPAGSYILELDDGDVIATFLAPGEVQTGMNFVSGVATTAPVALRPPTGWPGIIPAPEVLTPAPSPPSDSVAPIQDTEAPSMATSAPTEPTPPPTPLPPGDTFAPSPSPTASPTAPPTASPTASPTAATPAPSASTPAPTEPTPPPTPLPPGVTFAPSRNPTASPTPSPTARATSAPSTSMAPSETSILGSISGYINESPDLIGFEITITLKDEDLVEISSFITGPNAPYVFYDLPAGTYVIERGDEASITTFLAPGENQTGMNFDFALRRIGGAVMEDTNGDNEGDIGIDGVQIVLTHPDGSVIGNILTDDDGNFLFEDLDPICCYKLISGNNIDGFVDVPNSDGSNPNELVVDLTASDSLENIFKDRMEAHSPIMEPAPGFTEAPNPNPSPPTASPSVDIPLRPPSASPLGSISGKLAEDTFNNGFEVVLTLKDAETGEEIDTYMAGTDGTFLFDGVPDGDYVIEINPGSVVVELSLAPGETKTDIVIDNSPGNNTPIVITPSPTTTPQASSQAPSMSSAPSSETLGTISGYVTGPHDPALGVWLTLKGEDGDVIDTYVSDGNDYYEFLNLPIGPYEIEVDFWYVGGTIVADKPVSVAVFLGPGEEMGVDVMLPAHVENPSGLLGSITGYVTDDLNDDDFAFVIKLIDGAGEIVFATVPDSEGKYAFYDLPAGFYAMELSESNQMVDTYLGEGQNLTGVNFTNTVDNRILDLPTPSPSASSEPTDHLESTPESPTSSLGSISGYVSDDVDHDEFAFVIMLIDGDGEIVFATVPDSEGRYAFYDLPSGVYGIELADFDLTVDTILGEGQNKTGVNFTDIGDREILDLPTPAPSTSSEPSSSTLGSISGYIRGPHNTETGVWLTLKNEEDEIITTTVSDSNEYYVFRDLPSGPYSIETDSWYIGDQIVFDEKVILDVSVGDGERKTMQNITLPPIYPPRTIAGHVLEDIDGDAVGDIPIGRVLLMLADPNGFVVQMTRTDEDGKFAFVNVPPGIGYTVTEANNDGFVDVTDSDGGNTNQIVVDVMEEDVEDLEFVDTLSSAAPSVSPEDGEGSEGIEARSGAAPRRIEGQVQRDHDNDKDGDSGLEWEVGLVLLGPDLSIAGMTGTDEEGHFEFESLEPICCYTLYLNEYRYSGYSHVNDSDGGILNEVKIDLTDGDELDVEFVKEKTDDGGDVEVEEDLVQQHQNTHLAQSLIGGGAANTHEAIEPDCPANVNDLWSAPVNGKCDAVVWQDKMCEFGDFFCPACDDEKVRVGSEEFCMCDGETGQWMCALAESEMDCPIAECADLMAIQPPIVIKDGT